MNMKAIFLIAVIAIGMTSIHGVSSADVFSGFVDDSGTYTGLGNVLSEWTVDQYDSSGHKIVKTHWMKKHEGIDLKKPQGNAVYFQYAQFVNGLGIINYRDTVEKMWIYNYIGGELKVVPEDNGNIAKNYDVYINGRFVATEHADTSDSQKLYLPYYQP